MKKLILLFLPLFLVLESYAQFRLEVGDSKFIELPDAPYGGYINQAEWGCDNANISVDGSIAGAIIKINHYFTGTATVEAYYQYAYISSWTGSMQVGTSIEYYNITCIGKKVSINETSLTLDPGESYKLKISGGSSLYKPVWYSDNNSAVQVSQDGVVTAKSHGYAIITCDPIVGPKVYCDITVKAIAPKSVSISPNEITLAEGTSSYLKAEFSPSGAYASLTWSSENDEIATVSLGGYVKAIKAGSTKIKVHTDNGLSATCKVIVTPAPTAVHLPENIELLKGFNTTLTPTFTPSNSTISCTWYSSNTSVVTVSSSGKITAKNTGVANITVTTTNGKSATCGVTVKEAPAYINDRISRIKDLINKTKNVY